MQGGTHGRHVALQELRARMAGGLQHVGGNKNTAAGSIRLLWAQFIVSAARGYWPCRGAGEGCKQLSASIS